MTSVYNRVGGKNRFQIASASERPLFSAWLDEEFNAIYNDLNGLIISQTVSASEWTYIAGTYTQTNSTTFTVDGDKTGVFEPMHAIQFTDGSNAVTTSHIQSATYNSGTQITTVVVYDGVVPSTISKIGVGIVSNESAAIPTSNTAIKTANYTVGALDKILLCNDSSASGSYYDDGQVGGYSYPALLITLPTPASLPNKLICVKKIAGGTRIIVSSSFTHSTSLNADNETVHTNTYDFQILGDTTAKNRVELKGIGDCFWFVSNGTNWYELTPEASESVKGVVRFATNDEMTLTAQQIEDNESLKKDLAVSAYNVDAHYLRTDASNMRFASNFIYQTPNGAPYLDNNYHIIVPSGTGFNIATGRDDSGIITTKRLELDENLEFSATEVTDKPKYLFITSAKAFEPILAANFYAGYATPNVTDTQVGDVIIWFDYGANLLKKSTDNGTNWTTFDGCGPICRYSGNNSYINTIIPYNSVGFVTRDMFDNSRYVKETYQNGTSWYRIWSDGWCEQGGRTTGSNAMVTVTFLKPFLDTDYTIVSQQVFSENDYSTNLRGIEVKTATTVKVSGYYLGSEWYACGYIA